MRSLIRRLVLEFSVYNRRRKARLILEAVGRDSVGSLLLCGALGSESQRNESIVERQLAAHAQRVIAFDVAARGPQEWPLVIADARRMPFRDSQFDLAIANAVIEHVGDEPEQRRMIEEHVRVAKHWVITTPNRWFPVESHTSALLVHWLPRWRRRQTEFTRLLSLREFKRLLPVGTHIIGTCVSPTFIALGPGAEPSSQQLPRTAPPKSLAEAASLQD